VSADIAALRLPYEALVFDLGGVIASHDNDVLLARVARHCPGPDASLRLVEILRGAAIGSGRETVATLHARLREQCGLALDWPAFAEIWCSHLGLDPAMLDFVEALAIHHRVMLFSNTNAEHWNFLVALSAGRLGRFEAYLSHELGLEKPRSRLFTPSRPEPASMPPGRCSSTISRAISRGPGAPAFRPSNLPGRLRSSDFWQTHRIEALSGT
jgi:hypothetical protein